MHKFAYNTGALIDGTIQVGYLAISITSLDYSTPPGGLVWWNGPDEDLGYVIAYSQATCDHPTPAPLPDTACLGFYRSDELTTDSFLTVCNSMRFRTGETPFITIGEALNWLADNGYWTSYNLGMLYIGANDNIKTMAALTKTNYTDKEKLAIIQALSL